MSRQGCFLVLEGVDGAGTTTQANVLADAMTQSGREVVLTRQPSAGPVGRLLRQALSHQIADEHQKPLRLDWRALALLFSADRVDHVVRVIEPALRRGALVVCDRYDLSGLIYQSLTSPEGDQSLPWLRELNRHAVRPHLTLVLTLAAEEAASRRASRAQEAELYEESELQTRLAVAYERARHFLPDDRIEIIPGRGSREEVAARIARSLDLVPEFASWARSGG